MKKTNFRENNKGRAQRCLHLVNLPEEKKSREELPMDEIIFPFRIRSIRSDVPIIPTLVDCSLESQVLHVLKAASDRGATQKVSLCGFFFFLQEDVGDTKHFNLGNWFCSKYR